MIVNITNGENHPNSHFIRHKDIKNQNVSLMIHLSDLPCAAPTIDPRLLLTLKIPEETIQHAEDVAVFTTG